ncbi:MAG: HAMP domain-containing sensor histidine kinase, partial [Actinomycetota bacterium]
ALIPALQIAIAPPRWLRRIWRSPETQALRASRDLVMHAPDRPTLAARALDWAQRLVGGDAGFIATEKLNVLAHAGMEHDDACDMAARLRATEQAATVKLPGRSGLAIVAPVRTESGLSTLVVLSGPYIQLFGSEELQLVTEYATEIGLALDRVRLTEELQRLDVARREFIANAAHELRTPLTAILGFSSMLSGDPSKMPTEQLSVALDTIHRHALRMRLLINNLLDLAQLEQRKLRVFTVPTSLAAAVKQAIDGVPPSEEHSLTIEVPADITVIADPLRLEQIVTNLVTNAFKYGGPNVHIEARADDHMAMMVVSDDGPGVPEDVRAHIFDPFVRGDGTAGVQGSGLGLAIVRNLVQAFGGDAWYEDAQPHGARFVMAFKTEQEPDGDEA